MQMLCNLLNVITNPIIIAVAIVEFILMWVSLYIMWRFKHRIVKLNKKELKRSNKAKKDGKGVIEKTLKVEVKRDWEEFDQFLEDYQKQGCWYSAFSLIIQIFTLLGILGTVAGLYLAMSYGQDMYVGVEMALSTTILGILFAVLYKVVDIFITSMFINFIEDGINRYEKVYKVDSDDAMVAVMDRVN